MATRSGSTGQTGRPPSPLPALLAPSIDTVSGRRTHCLGLRPNGFGSGSGFPQDIDNSLFRQHFSNGIMIFKKGLSIAEMDTVGQYLARRFDATWADAS